MRCGAVKLLSAAQAEIRATLERLCRTRGAYDMTKAVRTRFNGEGIHVGAAGMELDQQGR